MDKDEILKNIKILNRRMANLQEAAFSIQEELSNLLSQSIKLDEMYFEILDKEVK